MNVINELVRFELTDIKGIKEFFQAHGIVVKHGSFAIVLIQGTTVYKVWLNDTAYQTYLDEIISQLQGNPFVPELIEGPLHVGKFTYIKLERLVQPKGRAKWSALQDILHDELYDVNDAWQSLEAIREQVPNIDNILEYVDDFFEFYKAVQPFVHMLDSSRNILERDGFPVFADPLLDEDAVKLFPNRS
jgi:hypothetical protein